MKVRKATLNDLEQINSIYAYAREFMKETGNPNQWKDNRPSKESIMSHLENKETYVIYDQEIILGVFVLVFGIDKTYINIEGKWLNNEDYVTVHGLAAAKGSKGIFDTAIGYAKAKSLNVRIDTHKDNKIMQHLITKAGFEYTGIIYVDDGSPRLAYQWVEKNSYIPKKDLYIVDYDGTIIFSMEMWGTMCSSFLKDNGYTLKEDVDRRSITQTNVETARYMIENYFNDLTTDEMEIKMNEYVANKYINQRLKDNAVDMLKKMKAMGKVVLFSATALPLLELSIKHLGLGKYFDNIYSASAMGITKKDGSGYLELLKIEGIKPENSLVVEDAIHAIIGAKIANLEVLGIEDTANKRVLADVYNMSDYYLRMNDKL